MLYSQAELSRFTPACHKKYIEQEEEREKAATAIAEGRVTNVTCNGESCEPELSPDIDDDSDFLEIGGYVAKE